MATDLLNDRQLKLAKPAEKEYLLADGQGLFLRIRPSGAKDWLFVYTFAAKRRKLGLGSFDGVSLATARAEADKARDSIARQIDPQLSQLQRVADQAAKREALKARKERLSVNELFGKWEQLALSARKDKGAEVRRSFDKDVLPTLGDNAAEDVRRVDVARILDNVVSRDARIVARNLLGDIRQMYGFGIARGLLEIDPTSHMKRDDYGRKVERERVLTDAELKALANALPSAHMAKTAELAIWLQLATCCRVGELSQAKWADVDMKAQTWRIPAGVAKNAHEHAITLSDFALAQFKALHGLTATTVTVDGETIPCEWVMPARKGETHVDLKSLTKQVGDRQRGDKDAMSNRSSHGKALILSGGRWTPHDLRRTGATMMVELGALPEVVERCLNHREQNRVKRIYQRHDYKKEMAAAWKLLGERVDALLTAKDAAKVVALQTRKRRA